MSDKLAARIAEHAKHLLEQDGHTHPVHWAARLDTFVMAAVCDHCGQGVPWQRPSGWATPTAPHHSTPDPTLPAVGALDALLPAQPPALQTPVELEQHLLDVTRRIELGAALEAEAIADAEKAAADWARLYNATLLTSEKRSADLRKAEAEHACEQAGLTAGRLQAELRRKMLKSLMHNLRAALSGYQSTSKSVSSAYGAGGGSGQTYSRDPYRDVPPPVEPR